MNGFFLAGAASSGAGAARSIRDTSTTATSDPVEGTVEHWLAEAQKNMNKIARIPPKLLMDIMNLSTEYGVEKTTENDSDSDDDDDDN